MKNNSTDKNESKIDYITAMINTKSMMLDLEKGLKDKNTSSKTWKNNSPNRTYRT